MIRKPLMVSVRQDTNAICWLTPRDHKHLALSVDGCSFLREVWRYWIKTATVSDKKAYLCSLPSTSQASQCTSMRSMHRASVYSPRLPWHTLASGALNNKFRFAQMRLPKSHFGRGA